MRKVKNMLVGASVALASGVAMAEGEPGAEVLTTVQTAITGTIGLVVTAVGALAVLGLGLWAAPFILRKVKGAVSAAS